MQEIFLLTLDTIKTLVYYLAITVTFSKLNCFKIKSRKLDKNEFMNNTKVKSIFCFLCGIIFLNCTIFALSYEELLNSYLNNDSSLLEAELNLENAKLSKEQTLFNNEDSFTLSTGNVKLESKNSTTSVSLSPSLSYKMPTFSNSELKVTAPLSFQNDSSGFSASLQNASVIFAADLISDKNDQIEINLQKADRTILEASRKVESRKIALEKSLLNEIKSLYSSKQAIMDAEENLLSKTNALTVLQIQGYSENSAKYRTALLSQKSAQFDLERQKKNFEFAEQKFTEKCNIQDFDLDNLEIPLVEAINIEDFDKQKYSEIENATWTNYITALSTDSKKDFSLQAQGGVNLSANKNAFSPSVSGGLSGTYNSITANVNVSVPLDKLEIPGISFSLSWNPQFYKTKELADKTEKIKSQQEEISLQKTFQNYENSVSDFTTKKESLLWQYEKNLEEYNLYKELETDTKKWFDDGLISESDYNSAVSNYSKAKVSLISTKIELLIYNIDLKSLFVE